jgi:hypothetical protein
VDVGVDQPGQDSVPSTAQHLGPRRSVHPLAGSGREHHPVGTDDDGGVLRLVAAVEQPPLDDDPAGRQLLEVVGQ